MGNTTKPAPNEWKSNPVLLMLREYRNAIKEKGGARAFLEKYAVGDDEFTADLLHRKCRMSKQELINYLELMSNDMRKDKFYHAYIEFVGQRTKPFIARNECGPRELAVTYAFNSYEYGSIYMWYSPEGTFCRYIIVPHINKDNKIERVTILLDVEIYNYQAMDMIQMIEWEKELENKNRYRFVITKNH